MWLTEKEDYVLCLSLSLPFCQSFQSFRTFTALTRKWRLFCKTINNESTNTTIVFEKTGSLFILYYVMAFAVFDFDFYDLNLWPLTSESFAHKLQPSKELFMSGNYLQLILMRRNEGSNSQCNINNTISSWRRLRKEMSCLQIEGVTTCSTERYLSGCCPHTPLLKGLNHPC